MFCHFRTAGAGILLHMPNFSPYTVTYSDHVHSLLTVDHGLGHPSFGRRMFMAFNNNAPPPHPMHSSCQHRQVVNEPSIKEFYLAAGASVTTDCPPVNGSCGFEEAVGFRSRWSEGAVRGPTGATMNVKY